MMRQIIFQCVYFILVNLAVTCSAIAADSFQIPKHLLDLRLLLQEVTSQHTDYVYGEPDVVWKGENGARYAVSYTDCSGLIDALLNYSYGINRNKFHEWSQKSRPKAREYYYMIENGIHFEEINNFEDVVPGDIIAFLFPPGSSNIHHDTGHVAVINKKPLRIQPEAPIYPGTTQWEIDVIDSSGGHGKDDSRYLSNGLHHRGLGEGIMRIYTNQKNQIIGYTWSLSEHSVFQPFAKRPVAVGRIKLK